MVGRQKEQRQLRNAIERKEAQFIAVYGRRRVGKTYLVREFFGNEFCFYHTGVANVDTEEQLLNFRDSLVKYGYERCPAIKSWREAFLALEKVVENGKPGKKIVFLDELPWMDTRKSKFVSALEHFWNGWASARKDVVLIVCGSATSWMISKILKDHGGLHNRVTDRIRLEPFSLGECELYCRDLSLNFSREDICLGYMIFGGVPFYWSLMERDKSIRQNVDALVFADGGKLRSEYGELFSSLFKESAMHSRMIEAIGSVKSGVTREAILTVMKVRDGGKVTKCLEDLENSGFIRRYVSLGKKKKDAIFQLVDNFVLFHLEFLREDANHDEHFWANMLNTQRQASWCGRAFERVCLHHVWQLKHALQIGGVCTSVRSWFHVADEEVPEGAQIDLLIDRADGVIDVCEMKYTKREFVPTEKNDDEMRRRISVFEDVSKTRKTVNAVLVTPYGISSKSKYAGRYTNVITFEDLFRLEQ